MKCLIILSAISISVIISVVLCLSFYAAGDWTQEHMHTTIELCARHVVVLHK